MRIVRIVLGVIFILVALFLGYGALEMNAKHEMLSGMEASYIASTGGLVSLIIGFMLLFLWRRKKSRPVHQ